MSEPLHASEAGPVLSPAEIIAQRADGTITTAQMMQQLRAYHYTSFIPAPDDWDPLAAFAIAKGTINQIGIAFDDGLLSETEHDAIVTDPNLHVTRTHMPSRSASED